MGEKIQFVLKVRQYEIDEDDQWCGLRKKVGYQDMLRLARLAGYQDLRDLSDKAIKRYSISSPLSMGEVATDRNQFMADELIEAARKLSKTKRVSRVEQ